MRFIDNVYLILLHKSLEIGSSDEPVAAGQKYKLNATTDHSTSDHHHGLDKNWVR